MIYILDTDMISLIVKRNNSVITNLIKHEDDEICISTIHHEKDGHQHTEVSGRGYSQNQHEKQTLHDQYEL